MTYYTPEPAAEPWWNIVPKCIHCGETSGMHLVTRDGRLQCMPELPDTSSEKQP